MYITLEEYGYIKCFNYLGIQCWTINVLNFCAKCIKHFYNNWITYVETVKILNFLFEISEGKNKIHIVLQGLEIEVNFLRKWIEFGVKDYGENLLSHDINKIDISSHCIPYAVLYYQSGTFYSRVI